MAPLLEFKTEDTKKSVNLYKEPQDINISNNTIVYQDIKYNLKLKNIFDISSIEIFINGDNRNYRNFKEVNDGIEIFIDEPIFRLSYGMIELIIHIEYNNGHKETLFTEYIAVAIKKIYENSIESLYEMIDIIYADEKNFLYSDVRSVDVDSIKYTIKQKSLNNQISTEKDIMSKILEILKKNLIYFINNNNVSTKSEYCIESFEKIKYIDSKTIQYIISNPKELKREYSNFGIMFKGNKYMPRKVLMQKNCCVPDTYENRMIVSFIFTIIVNIKNRINDIDELLSRNLSYELSKVDIKSEYILCSKIIQKYIYSSYINYKKELIKLKKQFIQIYNQYSQILINSNLILKKLPKLTPTFLEVYHYRNIFQSMSLWFRQVHVELPKENVILKFYNSDRIYEYYCLLGIYDTIVGLGFSEIKDSRNKYEYRIDYKKISNTEIDNTFYFRKDDIEVTLYYQPIIYSKNVESNNDIELLRVDKNFYMPDFIIKKKIDNKIEYGILDAKWRNRKTLLDKSQSGGINDSIYKYMYSIIDMKNLCNINFLWLLQGKDDKEVERMWIKRKGLINIIKDERVILSSGILKYTPKSGNKELNKVLSIFLSK